MPGDRPTCAATYAGGVPVDALPYATASWGRRVIALLVDWFASLAVVSLFYPVFGETGGPGSLYTMLVFVAESTIFTATMGGSFGKLVARLRVVRVPGGGRLSLWRSLVRAVLVALVIPPLVFRPDRRGLHDMAVDSATVPLEAAPPA